MNNEFSRQIFEKWSDIKFHENPAGGSRAVPQGRSARHDGANSRLSQFCEGAWWVSDTWAVISKDAGWGCRHSIAAGSSVSTARDVSLPLRGEKFSTFRQFLGGLDRGIRFEMSTSMHMATAPHPRSVVTSWWWHSWAVDAAVFRWVQKIRWYNELQIASKATWYEKNEVGTCGCGWAAQTRAVSCHTCRV